jgi:hypothetical protein
VKFSLSTFLLTTMLVALAIVAWYNGVRAQQAESRLYDVDVLLDRWIDARQLSHDNRLKSIEKLLETRKSADWFWQERNDHKFSYKDGDE